MTGLDDDTAAESRTRRLRPLGGLLAAMAVALTGTRVSAIALPWFVLVTTGSVTQTGLVAFFEMAPYVVVKALTGPLVDRTGPRVVSWTTDLASAAAAGAVPLLHATGLLSFPVLLALVAVIGAVRGPGDLAKEIMVPEAAERARVPLERATGLSGVTERLASTLGPAAGGFMVALLGPLTGLAVNAACFALGSLIIALALPRGMGRPADQTPPSTGYWRRFGEGFTFLRGEPLLLTIIVMIGITNLLDAAFNTVLLPVWAQRSGNGPTAIGLSNGMWSAAAVAGSLVAAAVAHRMPRRVVFFAGFLLAGAPRFLVLAADVPMWAVLAVFAASGAGGGFLNPILGAIAFERVPPGMRGRVNALGDSMAWAGIPVGGLLAGAAVVSLGLAPALLIGGAAYFLTTNLAALLPQWREMDRLRGRGAARRTADPDPGPPAGVAPADDRRERAQ
ncbi:MFS transporter [Microbispora sp. H11081]|uniref:MFS transporter n=1 Tax=Microbispora sp. H11081 TaxID=2729107 RepID=UPI001B8D7DEB|nr:MFS transporter [Microbispora sp. H11081]